MLIGKYNHTIDNKNRISLPSKWRSYLGDKIIITKGIEKNLFIYNLEEWGKIAATLNSNSFLNEDARNMSRFIFANAYDLTIDSHGRVLIPEQLKTYADLMVNTIIAGSYNRAEIWSEDNYNQIENSVSSNIIDIASRMQKEMITR